MIKFTKESEIKFISHLDLMRTLQRAIRRAELPVEYSKGFNPHMNLSIAQPLSVGVYSEGEYMDLVLREEMEEREIMDKLNKSCPRGIRILSVHKVIQKGDKKVPQAMALIDAASYTIKIKYNSLDKLEKSMKELLNMPQWVTVKKSKKGEKEVDIKALIKDFKYWIKDDYLVIKTTIACGSKENLSAELISNYIKEKTEAADLDAFVQIKREEMFAYKGNKLVPLSKYV